MDWLLRINKRNGFYPNSGEVEVRIFEVEKEELEGIEEKIIGFGFTPIRLEDSDLELKNER